jgi:hypothetical protein
VCCEQPASTCCRSLHEVSMLDFFSGMLQSWNLDPHLHRRRQCRAELAQGQFPVTRSAALETSLLEIIVMRRQPRLVSMDWGTRWAESSESLLAEVPSAIVLEESYVLSTVPWRLQVQAH